MICIDTVTRSIQVVLAGAKTTNDAQCYCVFYDLPRQTKPTYEDYQRAAKAQDTNGTTAVTVCAAPSLANVSRMIEHLSVHNYDTASVTATVQVYDTVGPTTTRLKKVTLTAGQGLSYESGAGWIVL